MPRIFDNIEAFLAEKLNDSLSKATRADFCVGYFNLRGWNLLAQNIDNFQGDENHCCRLLIGMQQPPQELLEQRWKITTEATEDTIDRATMIRYKQQTLEEFRRQLQIGLPNATYQKTIQSLIKQLQDKKVEIKLFTRHPLHAKLYLIFRNDRDNPIIGYLGSSNLTLHGLEKQGELNIDVLEHDASEKLSRWFENRWNDRFCVDVSVELIRDVIEQSWARTELIPPYHIYLKILYHLSEDARTGLEQYSIPQSLKKQLFEYQIEAVKIAMHRLDTRAGIMIGDVVGLGKTLIATTIIKIFEEQGFNTLIICPKNLVLMWEDYCKNYVLGSHILPLSQIQSKLGELRRFRLVVIDESHNLRNRDGKRYQQLHDYLHEYKCKVLLLSATPYNKNYLDLANQLRLFIGEEQNLGIRPEQLLQKEYSNNPELFTSKTQCSLYSLAAFEKSGYTRDWQELMRLYLLRRTREFIQKYYAKTDATGKKYLLLSDGQHAYFPTRRPKTIHFSDDSTDTHAQLYSDEVIELINQLHLPRYGLARYLLDPFPRQPTEQQEKLLANLSKADQRLRGFCRINLFKRLESSVHAFRLSIERHLLRNQVYLHALETHQPIPIGAQDANLLDSIDRDIELVSETEDDDTPPVEIIQEDQFIAFKLHFKQRAREIYQLYLDHPLHRFQWLPSEFLKKELADDLREDIDSLLNLLDKMKHCTEETDGKLQKLLELLTVQHPTQKILIFTQFADTARYLEKSLQFKVSQLEAVTGDSQNPTDSAYRFSPISNKKSETVQPIRVLIATDVLSEGQNLQDCATIVNYDLTWAIIRLIQRAGRVDRIGQQADEILCYSFLPAAGVEEIIGLRKRLIERLRQNREVIGSDEQFFEDEQNNVEVLRDLYSEKAGVLDGADTEVDLASQAYRLWKEAIQRDPKLEFKIKALPQNIFSAKPPVASQKTGTVVYLKTGHGNDVLSYFDTSGQVITESHYDILEIARCQFDTPTLICDQYHHDLVERAVKTILRDEGRVGGQLGKNTVPYRIYRRLKDFPKNLFTDSDKLEKVIDAIYNFPLQTTAARTLKANLKHGISDQELARMVISLHNENRLVINDKSGQIQSPVLICSLGIYD